MSEYNKKIARIGKIETEMSIKDSKEFLRVDVQVIDPNYINEEGKPVPTIIERRSFGYPLETSEDEITKSIKKFIDEYNREKEQLIKDEKNIEARKKITNTITNLTNGVIR